MKIGFRPHFSFGMIARANSGNSALFKGQISLHTPFLFAMTFIGLFVFGGLTGLMLAMLAIDVHVHGTYFVITHFHYIMVGGTISAFFGALHYWWPKITGRMCPLAWGRVTAIFFFYWLQSHILPAIPTWLPRHAETQS
ncbi:cbb3-type cytochrome c oxidase subunit I [Rhizobium sp. P28RR-XV]|uniref:cbb3-type cytochrome c oxidase subunit I n=1 Tax=Rhizobium sp. P28RR-XV TaxID=2726737 RepID=UPI0028A8B780|nr:cbb3-type cytochrome c oxidase subunit I [Rhizobium sp. P28RR-XV]